MRTIAQWDKILEDENVLEDDKVAESVPEIAENIRRLATRVIPQVTLTNSNGSTLRANSHDSTVVDSKCTPVVT